MTLLSRLKAAARALAGITHPRGVSSWYESCMLPRTSVDYAAEVGDGLGSNILMAPVQWIARAFLEARIGVTSAGKDEKIDTSHDLAVLLDRPNPHYSGAALMNATLYSWYFDGNAYWLKNRNGAGEVKEIWYVPHWMIEPKHNGDEFLSYYEYKPGGNTQIIQPVDVVHMRFGVDPYNVRKGMSPVHSLLREIFNDDESANQVARLLANGCVPGVIISPKDGSAVSKEDLKITKEYIRSATGGDNKGAPLALGAPTELQQYGYDPKTMDLSAIRNVSEERVCALLGIPAAVVGFGTGIEQTKVGATLEELSKIAWRNGVIPTQELLAGEMTRSLGPDFGLAPAQRLAWDRHKVWALQDDMTKQSERLAKATGGPWITVAEARSAQGLDVGPEHEVFLLPGSVTPTKPEDLLADPEPIPAPLAAVPEPPAPAKAKGLKFPTKAAVRSKHNEMIRMLEAQAPKLRAAAHRFMKEQADRISAKIAGGADWKLADRDAHDLADTLRPEIKRSLVAGLMLERDFVNALLGKGFDGVRVKATRYSDRVAKWTDVNALKWAKDINDTTYATVDEAIQDALESGASIAEASKSVAEALDMERDYRTTRIAQTETLAALNEGALEAYRENTEVAGKGWLPVRDEFTRKSHLDAGDAYNEDSPIGVEEDFTVGSASGPAPGQMGDPAEDCNCRCAIFPVVKERP